MQKSSDSSSNKNYELAALAGSAASILGLGAGMAFNKPGVGAVLGAGVGLIVRAWVVSRASVNAS